MLVVRHSPDKSRLRSLELSGGRVPLTFLRFLFYSFDTLVAVEYGDRRVFCQSFLNFMRNCNKHLKPADKPDMSRQEAFRQLCIALYAWALQFYQTLPNFVSHRAIICYSFLCLVVRVGQFMHTGHLENHPTSKVMLN